MRCSELDAAAIALDRGYLERDEVVAHLAECPACRDEARYLVWLAGSLRALPRANAPARTASEVLARTGGGDERRRPTDELRITRLESPMGPLYVAYGPEGIRRVAIGDAAGAALLARVDPGGEPEPADRAPRRVAGAVAAYFAGRREKPEAFDLRGLPPFDRSVLLKALEIPWGEIRPYVWIAREIGHPGASRAVGQALGKNPIPLLIPCHRVVRSDGGLGGYAFGLPLKRAILTREGVDLERLDALARSRVRVVGSRTTSVYCLPTCRHARRIADENQVGFGSAEEARRAGYRPCQVCRP